MASPTRSRGNITALSAACWIVLGLGIGWAAVLLIYWLAELMEEI